MSESPRLSALILTFNEGANIGPVIGQVFEVLKRLDADCEVVVVDGGSKDDTQARAREAGAVVYQQRAPGYGAAFAEGLQHARGEWIVTLDADLSHNPETLVELWERRHEADLVIGSRYVPGGSYEMTPFRRFLSHFMNGTYRLVLEIPTRDLSSGFRLYRKRCLEGLELTSPLFDVLEEVLIKLVNRGYSVLEIPIHYAPRLHGESHLRVVKFGLAYYHTLIRLARLRHHPDAADYEVRASRSLLPWRRVAAANRRARLSHLARPLLDAGGAASAIGIHGDVVAVSVTPEQLRVLQPSSISRLVVNSACLPLGNHTMAAAWISDIAFLAPEALSELRRVLQSGATVCLERKRMPTNADEIMRRGGFEVVVDGPIYRATLAPGNHIPKAPALSCPKCRARLLLALPLQRCCSICGNSFETEEGILNMKFLPVG